MKEMIILVDEKDQILGKEEKLKVHELGLLHRAFSIFIFNDQGELLLQQRADEKYHSPGLWTNTCCSHPNFGEELPAALKRRLMQEMGMDCETQFAFSFIYKAEFENGLTEHEYDHVYFGFSNQRPKPAKEEVQNWKYISLKELKQEIDSNPSKYTPWLKICLPEVQKHFENLSLPSNY
jgi:isopentenyl-diphosphate delta-isomerase